MTPIDLSHLSEEIKKTQNWSNHRKQMFGMGLMNELYITDGSVSKTSPVIIPASDRAMTTQLVSDVLDDLIAYDEIDPMVYPLEGEPVSGTELDFPHLLILNNEPGIQYILNTHLWLKVMDDPERTLALVVTGNLSGAFTFYIEQVSGQFEKMVVNFDKNGIYLLTKLSVDVLHLTDQPLTLH
ncbi:hypothetical protein ACWOAN_06485 [Lactococcus taiwanensis]|uniref:hypothetical protein n=1 Tax=Lactococcus taiwanensis TaxID=1151742 RepID=UPI00190620BC|nr:hypothetical protein [Lactococcus taiwanensis]QRZ11064.1 hypothetical protein JVB21_10060 [Lactococcus taiwanensis]